MVYLIIGILCGIILNLVFGIIKNNVKILLKDKIERFNYTKFYSGLLDIYNPVLWAKDICQLFNIRKLILYGIIIGAVFGYGYYKGIKNKPINLNLGYGKEARIKLNGTYLHIYKDGSVYVEDTKGTKLKQIKVKDVPELKRLLKPYGLQLKPIIVCGYSGDFEIGAGFSWLKWYNWRLDSFLTNHAIYPLGASYSITENSGVGLGAGIGYKGDKRVIIYYRWNF